MRTTQTPDWSSVSCSTPSTPSTPSTQWSKVSAGRDEGASRSTWHTFKKKIQCPGVFPIWSYYIEDFRDVTNWWHCPPDTHCQKAMTKYISYIKLLCRGLIFPISSYYVGDFWGASRSSWHTFSQVKKKNVGDFWGASRSSWHTFSQVRECPSKIMVYWWKIYKVAKSL